MATTSSAARKKADSASEVEPSKTTDFFRILSGLGVLVIFLVIATCIAFLTQERVDDIDIFKKIQQSIMLAFKWVCIPVMYLITCTFFVFYIASLVNDAKDENNTIRRVAAALLPVVALVFVAVLQKDVLQYLRIMVEYRSIVCFGLLLVGLLLPEILRKIDADDNGAAALMCFILASIATSLLSVLVFVDMNALHWAIFCFLMGLMINTAFMPAK